MGQIRVNAPCKCNIPMIPALNMNRLRSVKVVDRSGTFFNVHKGNRCSIELYPSSNFSFLIFVSAKLEI